MLFLAKSPCIMDDLCTQRHTKKTLLIFFSYWWWTHIHCSFMLLTWTICPCLLAIHRTQNNLCVLLSFLSAAVRPWRQPFTSKNVSVYCISWALLNMSLLISVKRVSTSSYRADSCFLRCLHCFYMHFFSQFKVCSQWLQDSRTMRLLSLAAQVQSMLTYPYGYVVHLSHLWHCSVDTQHALEQVTCLPDVSVPSSGKQR